ncbi:MAG: DUF4349 domain-containing protein [Planctomycetes bacterium]|nr:DUF4349 domain-containing protein [Planctomycetota bacterium]MCW8136864.1 DUF4349 domain-containing protein [Planctomycetota bacterium]
MKNALCACLFALALAGCQAARPAKPGDDSASRLVDRTDAVPVVEARPDPAEYRIQRQGVVVVRAKDEQEAATTLRRRAAEFDAIVMSMSTTSVTFKMPATKIEPLLQHLENTPKWDIKRLDFSALDRTGEYWSLEARIESTRAVRGRIMDMIERAGDINTLFSLEAKLEPVQQRLDQIEGTKRDVALKAGRVDVRIDFE